MSAFISEGGPVPVPRVLTDDDLERALWLALGATPRDVTVLEALRAEARRRFAGMAGLAPSLMEDQG